MPAANAAPRVKGVKIKRSLIIGSEALRLPEVGDPARPKGIPDEHRYSWRVYVRELPGAPDMTAFLQKVTFRLHDSYRDMPGGGNLRVSETRPFEVRETGWGGFMVDIKFHFQSIAAEKPHSRQHYLQLEPYGDAGQQEDQRKAGRVVSEQYEEIEFFDPTEALYNALTADSQFDYLDKGRGKGGKGGKGRGSMSAFVDVEERGVGLPAKSSKDNEFSQAMEEIVLEKLKAALQQVEKETNDKLARKEALEKQLQEYATTGDVPPPPRKR